MYKINGKEFDFNSNKNQTIKGKFVEREVYVLANSMTEYILSKSWEDSEAPFSWDDVTNAYEKICSECGGVEDFEKYETKSGATKFKCSCGKRFTEEEYDELDTQPAEIFQWFIVSDFLADKLIEQGQCVIKEESIWGRTCCGQAILLDYVISKICYEMGILEGQKYDWSE